MTGTSRSFARRLEVAGDPRHLLQAALLAAAGRHQLEVVDDDEAEVGLAALQRLRAGAELEEAEARRVVDVERRRLELAARLMSRGQSSFESLPVRMWCASTFAREHMRRCATSCCDISRLKNAHGLPSSTATWFAISSANALFPIDGRAARMMRFCGWKPAVRLSRSLNPLDRPVTSAPFS